MPVDTDAAAGRYQIRAVLGQGSMGAVYLAYDRRLRRDVALKLVSPSILDADHLARYQRHLLREAQHLAQLTHPNIVAILDVGLLDGDVFIAMERVQGDPLDHWLETASPSVDAILERFADVARGLAAAHRAGVIHRDVKPSNIMVRKDRAQLMDFGVARSRDASSAQPEGETDSRSSGPAGTPAFMAPEVRAGEPATEASDQYSYFVALHQALYGVFPGQPRDPATRRDSGLRLRFGRILRRGLHPDPSRRFRSMDDVVRALESPSRTRTSAWGGVGLAAAVAVGFGVRGSPNPQESGCLASTGDAVQRWRASQAAIGDRWQQAAPYGPALWERVEPRLAAYSEALESEAAAACTASNASLALDVRRQCVRSATRAFVGAMAVLQHADTDAAIHTVVDRLPAFDQCRKKDAAPSDDLDLPRLESLHEQLAKGRALREAGKHDEAQQILEKTMTTADQSGASIAGASARLELSMSLLESGGSTERAQSLLQQGFDSAAAAGHDEFSARAAAGLAFVIGYSHRNPSEAQRDLEYARAYAQRQPTSSLLSTVVNDQ